MSIPLYTLLSVSAAVGYMGYSIQKHEQFYPTVVHLSNASMSYLVFGNLFVCASILIGRFFGSFLLGKISKQEKDLIYDRAKFILIDAFLALSVFRAELSAKVGAAFLFLLYFKGLHILAKDRVQHLATMNEITVRSQWRLLLLLLILGSTDALVAGFVARETVLKGPSVSLFFGFEFAILLASCLAQTVTFSIHVIDASLESSWYSKGAYLFLVDLVYYGLRFLLYLLFFLLILTYYTLPFHLMREVYYSFVMFQKNLVAFLRYRALTRNLDTRFPDATQAELERWDRLCVICRDEMERGKILPCGHVFHLSCLREMLRHSQVCPMDNTPIPLTAPPPPVQQPGQANEPDEEEEEEEEEEGDHHNHHHHQHHNHHQAPSPLPSLFKTVVQTPIYPHAFVQEGEQLRTVSVGIALFALERRGGMLRVEGGWVEESRLAPLLPAPTTQPTQPTQRNQAAWGSGQGEESRGRLPFSSRPTSSSYSRTQSQEKAPRPRPTRREQRSKEQRSKELRALRSRFQWLHRELAEFGRLLEDFVEEDFEDYEEDYEEEEEQLDYEVESASEEEDEEEYQEEEEEPRGEAPTLDREKSVREKRAEHFERLLSSPSSSSPKEEEEEEDAV